ncbi:MAG TPA: hypothetical protein DDY32_05510, partial [Desulfobulbaceae bacterium]|nr:hypothetical protein [Desulfobulbaceae bacterium]
LRSFCVKIFQHFEIMSNEIISLTKEIERLATAHPHVVPLLQAFGPLLAEKQRWLQETPPAAPVP